jgi:Putative zinc-finger
VSDKPDIDKSFERVLSALLGDELSPPGEECPHPGSLAAYYENRLDGAEAERLDRHLAGCRPCQEQVAALVRLDPAPTAEVAPAAHLEPVSPLEERRGWGWRFRWVAAPVAVAATAMIAVTITHRYAAMMGEASRRVVNPESREMPIGEVATAAKRDETDRGAASSEVTSDAGGAGTTGGFAAAKPELEGMRPDTTAASAEPHPEGPSPATEDVRAVLVATRSNQQVAWRLRDGWIERTDDGGGSWRAQARDVAGLVSGSAPSPEVCWVVGKGGLVLRTTDGERWSPVKLPTEEDLVEIVAQNAETAVVTAASGRRFSTRDGGQSWSSP